MPHGLLNFHNNRLHQATAPTSRHQNLLVPWGSTNYEQCRLQTLRLDSNGLNSSRCHSAHHHTTLHFHDELYHLLEEPWRWLRRWYHRHPHPLFFFTRRSLFVFAIELIWVAKKVLEAQFIYKIHQTFRTHRINELVPVSIPVILAVLVVQWSILLHHWPTNQSRPLCIQSSHSYYQIHNETTIGSASVHQCIRTSLRKGQNVLGPRPVVWQSPKDRPSQPLQSGKSAERSATCTIKQTKNNTVGIHQISSNRIWSHCYLITSSGPQILIN